MRWANGASLFLAACTVSMLDILRVYKNVIYPLKVGSSVVSGLDSMLWVARSY